MLVSFTGTVAPKGQTASIGDRVQFGDSATGDAALKDLGRSHEFALTAGGITSNCLRD